MQFFYYILPNLIYFYYYFFGCTTYDTLIECFSSFGMAQSLTKINQFVFQKPVCRDSSSHHQRSHKYTPQILFFYELVLASQSLQLIPQGRIFNARFSWFGRFLIAYSSGLIFKRRVLIAQSLLASAQRKLDNLKGAPT